MDETNDVLDITRTDPRSTSELCVRCGICCVVLKAYCRPEEADGLCTTMGVDTKRFMGEETEDGCMIRFPCVFLRGRVLRGVACAAYGRGRPPVCRSYHCKIAIDYATRRISLKEALVALNLAFQRGAFSIFNWTGGHDEIGTFLRGRISREAKRMRADGIPQPVIDYRAAAYVTPRYVIPTEVDSDLMSMHLFSHDRRVETLDEATNDQDRLRIMRAAVGLYFEDGEAECMTDDDVAVAATAITAVLSDIRGLFTTRRDADFHERTGIPRQPTEAEIDDVAGPVGHGEGGGQEALGHGEGGGHEALGPDGVGQGPVTEGLAREEGPDVVKPPVVDEEAAHRLRKELNL